MRKMKDKKAQIGETMTWVIATIIIVVILIVSIFITSILGIVGSPKEYRTIGMKPDLVPIKSLTSYLLTHDLEGSEKTIFAKLKGDEEFDELNGPNGKLASRIFNNFYEDDYYFIWLGINVKENDYFGPYSKTVGWELQTNRKCLENFILLEEDKWAKLFLCN